MRELDGGCVSSTLEKELITLEVLLRVEYVKYLKGRREVDWRKRFEGSWGVVDAAAIAAFQIQIQLAGRLLTLANTPFLGPTDEHKP